MNKKDSINQDPNFVHSLAKGLEILSVFSEGEMLGNQQIVSITGMPKATVSRLTSTLTALGYLRVDPRTRKLLMGSRLIAMGVSVQRKIGLQRKARPLMERLSAETGLSLTMGTRDRLGLVILEAIRPPAETRLVTNIDAGTVLPIAETAIGLAYIVAASLKEQTSILKGLSQRFPDEWPLLRERIATANAEYSRFGFITSQRSWDREVNAVAIPFYPTPGTALYAFNFAGPATRMPLNRLRKELGPLLLEMESELREAMSRSPDPQLTPPKFYEP